MRLTMKIGTFFALCILVAVLSKVEGHGGLAFPYTWEDVSKRGDKGEFNLGCRDENPSLQPFTDKTQVLDGNPDQVVRRLSTPTCYWLFFNDQQTWKSGFSDDAPASDLRQMPSEMRGDPSNFKTEEFSIKRAECYNLDFNDPKQYAKYMRNWYCSQPWMEPGMADITSPCGVSGGNEGYAPLPFAQAAEKYTYPNAPVTTWKKGKAQKVIWNVHANHGGGYSYRLCKTPAEGIVGLTEECFQNTPLDFVGTDSELRKEGDNKWTKTKLPQTKIGTWPEGSMWRGISNLRQAINAKTTPDLPEAMRVAIKDMVMVPKNLPKGDYVLSFRWDTDRSNQVWSGCSNIKIT